MSIVIVGYNNIELIKKKIYMLDKSIKSIKEYTDIGEKIDILIVNSISCLSKIKSLEYKYLLLNSDANINSYEMNELVKNSKIITFGLNRKATITFSSINKNTGEYLISIQRTFENYKGIKILPQEIKYIVDKQRNKLGVHDNIILIDVATKLIKNKMKSRF